METNNSKLQSDTTCPHACSVWNTMCCSSQPSQAKPPSHHALNTIHLRPPPPCAHCRDGSRMLLTPESSVLAQKAFGADIIIPLDELPPYHMPEADVEASLARSHRWMARRWAGGWVQSEWWVCGCRVRFSCYGWHGEHGQSLLSNTMDRLAALLDLIQLR